MRLHGLELNANHSIIVNTRLANVDREAIKRPMMNELGLLRPTIGRRFGANRKPYRAVFKVMRHRTQTGPQVNLVLTLENAVYLEGYEKERLHQRNSNARTHGPHPHQGVTPARSISIAICGHSEDGRKPAGRRIH